MLWGMRRFGGGTQVWRWRWDAGVEVEVGRRHLLCVAVCCEVVSVVPASAVRWYLLCVDICCVLAGVANVVLREFVMTVQARCLGNFFRSFWS